MIEKLKEVKLENLSENEIVEHRNNVLGLGQDEAVEYLKYAIDTFYKTEEEGENDEKIDIFFDTDEFKPFYDVILSSEESE